MKMRDFKCTSCEKFFEELVDDDEEKVDCPHCGANTTERRLTGCHAVTGSGSGGTTGSSGCAPRGGFG
jgi:putative FmdB family regulatory protein